MGSDTHRFDKVNLLFIISGAATWVSVDDSADKSQLSIYLRECRAYLD